MKSNNKERQDVEFVLNKLKCWSLLKIALIKYAKSVYQLIQAKINRNTYSSKVSNAKYKTVIKCFPKRTQFQAWASFNLINERRKKKVLKNVFTAMNITQKLIQQN